MLFLVIADDPCLDELGGCWLNHLDVYGKIEITKLELAGYQPLGVMVVNYTSPREKNYR